MLIRTRIAPAHFWRHIVIALLGVAFFAWGAYDLWWVYPKRQARYEHYQALTRELEALEKESANLPFGNSLPPAKQSRLSEVRTVLDAAAPPVKPAKYDNLTCWIFMSSILLVPYSVLAIGRTRRQVYALDEDGSLHFTGDSMLGQGCWAAPDIADIDLTRWMARSVAHVVHRDGRRLKLDAYLHKDLDLIIGALASRLHPEEWDARAKPLAKESSGQTIGNSQ